MSLPKFLVGRLVATPNALEKIPNPEILSAFKRHVTGDWGEVDADDRQENELSLKEGFRLFSIYRSLTGVKFWIITEAGRHLTTVLLPEDY